MPHCSSPVYLTKSVSGKSVVWSEAQDDTSIVSGDHGVDKRHKSDFHGHTGSLLSGMAHKKLKSDYAGDLMLTCQGTPKDPLAMWVRKDEKEASRETGWHVSKIHTRLCQHENIKNLVSHF